MANATVETVSKVVEKKIEEKVYVLTLDETEALIVKSLVGNVGGQRVNTYRKITEGIFFALDGQGVKTSSPSTYFDDTQVFYGKKIPN